MVDGGLTVIGAGTMGCGIAQVAAAAGMSVTLVDINEDVVKKGLSAIARNLEKDAAKERTTAEEKDAILSRIVPCGSLEGSVRSAGFIIEAAVEDMPVKRSIFGQLGDVCPAEIVLATNTSSLSVTEIAMGAKHPERVIGLHFFNPAPVMKLVEIIRGAATSDETLSAARSLAERLGKTPVEVNEAPGFIVNRILIPMINEAAYILMEGVASKEDIDQAMKLGANHPMGPLALGDLIGLDVCLNIMEVLLTEFGDPKYRPCPLLRKMVRAGRLGRKSGAGFYEY